VDSANGETRRELIGRRAPEISGNYQRQKRDDQDGAESKAEYHLN
jgi:hypothetical protein